MSEFMEIPEKGDINRKFTEILTSKSEYLDSPDDLIVESFGEVLEYYIKGVCHKINRASQKQYSPTALEDTAILAKGQDANYIPRFPTPFKAIATVTNKNEAGGPDINYPVEQPIISELNDIHIMEDAVTNLIPQGSVDIEIHQEVKTEVLHSSDGKVFQEFVLGGSDVYKFRVYVNDVLWNEAGSFISIDETSQVYHPFYTYTGELSIRFGNNVFGIVPILGAEIKFVIYTTEGSGGSLQVGALLDEYNVAEANNVEIVVKSIVSNGTDQETASEMERSLPFFERSKGALGWSSDYIHSIYKGFSDVIWNNVWGEEEQEAVTGADIDNINMVRVSGYRTVNQAGLGTAVLAWLYAQKKPTNVKFIWHEPNILQFNIVVTGKVDKNINIDEAKAGITKSLNDYYGVDSIIRRTSVIKKEINEDIDGLGYFKNQLPHLKNRTERPEYSLSITGTLVPVNLYDMVTVGVISYNITTVS